MPPVSGAAWLLACRRSGSCEFDRDRDGDSGAEFPAVHALVSSDLDLQLELDRTVDFFARRTLNVDVLLTSVNILCFSKPLDKF